MNIWFFRMASTANMTCTNEKNSREHGLEHTISEFACALPWDPKTHENCIFLAKWAPTSGSWGTSHCYSVSKSIYLQLYKANATAYITSNIEENGHGSESKHGIHFHHQFFKNVWKNMQHPNIRPVNPAKFGCCTPSNVVPEKIWKIQKLP